MAHIVVKKVNESVLKISSNDHGILMEACEYFTFFAEGYKYMAAFKNRMWDGRVRLLDARNHTLPYGLLSELIKFANSRKYTVNIDVDIAQRVPTNKERLVDYTKTLTLTDSNNNIIAARDYQISAFAHACSEGRGLVISPTGSGKSLIIYMMVRWFLDHHDEKVLIVVPNTSLVEQMSKDFTDYCQRDDGFDSAIDVHKIYSGKEKNAFSSRVVVTTWQSAITLPKSWFLQYGMVVGDECIHPDSMVSMGDGSSKKISDIVEGEIVKTFNESKKIIENNKVVKVHKNLKHSCSEKRYKILMEDGSSLIITGNHKVKTDKGWVETKNLTLDHKIYAIE